MQNVKSMDFEVGLEHLRRDRLTSILHNLTSDMETRDPENPDMVTIPAELLEQCRWEIHTSINRENQRLNKMFTPERLNGYYDRNPRDKNNVD